MSFGFGFSLPAYTEYGGRFGAGATLLLDFTSGNQTLDSRVTFTRTTTATRTNSSGLIESVAINGPRFDYNPTTLAPLGLLIEEQRTNLSLRSQELDNAAWTKTASTITANATTAPDGTTTADKLVEDSSLATHSIIEAAAITYTSGVAYSFSFFIKKAERQTVQILMHPNPFPGTLAQRTAIFNSNTGAFVSVGSAYTGSSVTALLNGWYRVSVASTADATTTGNFTISLCSDDAGTTLYTGDGTSGLFLWGVQLEAGAFSTSYIPTVASQVTRTADVATMTGTNFSSWYNATEGTMYASYSIPFDSSVSVFPIVAAIADGTFSNTIATYERSVDDTRRAVVRAGGVEQADLTSGAAYVYGTTAKQAVAYKVNDFAMSANGAAVGVDTSGTVPVVDRLGLGGSLVTGGSLGYLNGTIKQIAFYPRRLANAELQAITS
jgi:hypothetical protein